MKKLMIYSKLFILTKRTFLAAILLSVLFALPFFISVVSTAFIDLCEKEAASLYGEFDNIIFGKQFTDLFSTNDNIDPSDYIESYGTISVGESFGNTVLGSIDNNAIEFGHVRLIRGDFPRNENDICICESLFYEKYYDSGINSEVVIGEKKYVLSGIINDYYIAWNKKSNDDGSAFPNAIKTAIKESELYEQIYLIKNKEAFPAEFYDNSKDIVANTNIVNGNTGAKYNIPDFVFSLLYTSIAIVMIYIYSFVYKRDYEIRSLIKQIGASGILLRLFSEIRIIGLSFVSIILGGAIAQLSARLFILIYNFSSSGIIGYPSNNHFSTHFKVSILISIIAYFLSLLINKVKKDSAVITQRLNQISGRNFLLLETLKSGKSILISSIVVAITLVTVLILSMYMKMYISSRSNVFGKMPIDFDYQFTTNQNIEDYSYIDKSGTLVSVKSLPDETAVYFMPNHSDVIDHKVIKAIEAESGVEKVDNYIDANDIYIKIDRDRINYEYLQGFPVEEQITESIANIYNIDLNNYEYRNAQFCGFPKEEIENLGQYVREGAIDYTKISSGDEIILIIPVYEKISYDDGSWAVNFLEYDDYSGKKEQFSDHTFSVGDIIELKQILPTNSYMSGYLNSNQLKNETELVTCRVKIGAIIYERVMWFEDSSQFPTAYTLIGAEDTFKNLGIKPTFSRTQIYLNKKTDFISFEPIIHKYQNELDGFIYKNNAAELNDYRRFMVLLQEICFVLIISSVCLMLIISISETYISYFNRRNHFAMLRIIGMPPTKYLLIILCRAIVIWFLSTTMFVIGGACMIKHIWGTLSELDMYLGYCFPVVEIALSYLIISVIVISIYRPLLRKYVIKYSVS